MLANEPLGEDGERGVCINTSSIAAYDGQVGQVAYAASKGAVASMTLPAARELAAVGDPRLRDRARPLRHAPARGAARRGARAARRTMPFPPRLGRARASSRAWSARSSRNPMLNGEVIRLDGALRMGPR